MSPVKGLRERLRDGENVVCAEGYMWELERRGFVTSGNFTPEVVLDYPERVKALHEEFVMTGSDVVEAFTYYGHKEKLKSINRESDFHSLNLNSLKMAREVADANGRLMAGNICNSTSFDPDDPKIVAETKQMFKEQIEWAVEGKADFIIGETFNELAEAKLALQAIQEYGNGLPSVITMSPYAYDTTLEGIPLPEALRQLEELGADVVGFNCARGPTTMLPLLKEARKACKGPLAALPAPFRTTPEENCYYRMKDPVDGKFLFPANLDCRLCSREDIRRFAEDALKLGVQYIGLCCGSSPSLMREIAQVYGRKPELGRFAPDTSKNYYMQKDLTPRAKKIKEHYFGDAANAV